MTYRNKKLLRSAKDQPCVLCGSVGTTIAAHANSVALGKGMGIKAPDYRIAFLCMHCHSLVDGRTGKLTKEEKQDMWVDGHVKTIGILFEQGIIRVA